MKWQTPESPREHHRRFLYDENNFSAAVLRLRPAIRCPVKSNLDSKDITLNERITGQPTHAKRKRDEKHKANVRGVLYHLKYVKNAFSL
jgi:hypothetical protein